MKFDTAELEQELCRIPEVYAARIVVNGSGNPSEARILASSERSPKRVRRDVQSVAATSFGVELPASAISVTQLERSSAPNTPPGLAGIRGLEGVFDLPGSQAEEAAARRREGALRAGGAARHGNEEERVAEERVGEERVGEEQSASAGPSREARGVELLRVSSSTDGSRTSFDVIVEAGGRRGAASAESSRSKAVELRHLGEATLQAVSAVMPSAADADVESVTLAPCGERVVAVACLAVPAVDGRDSTRSGCAVVGPGGEPLAVARAVLGAAGSGDPA